MVCALDLPKYARERLPRGLGRGGGAVHHLPGVGARDPGVGADASGVRGGGGDRVGGGQRWRALLRLEPACGMPLAPRDRELHGRDPAAGWSRVADDLLRRGVLRAKEPSLSRADQSRERARSGGAHHGAAAHLLRVDLAQGIDRPHRCGGAHCDVRRVSRNPLAHAAAQGGGGHGCAAHRALGRDAPGAAARARGGRVVRDRRRAHLLHRAPLPRVDARDRGDRRREPVRARAVGRAVPERVSREGIGLPVGEPRADRADGARQHGVEQHQSVDGARGDDSDRVLTLARHAERPPLRRRAARGDIAHDRAERRRGARAARHEISLVGRGDPVRALARAVSGGRMARRDHAGLSGVGAAARHQLDLETSHGAGNFLETRSWRAAPERARVARVGDEKTRAPPGGRGSRRERNEEDF